MGYQTGPITPSAASITQASIATSTGTIAARPAAASTAAPFYFATDIAGGQWYYNTGSAWTPADSSAPVSLAATTVFNGTSQAGGTDVTMWAPTTLPSAMWAVGTEIVFSISCDVDLLNSATSRNLVWKFNIGATAILTLTDSVAISLALSDQGYFLEGRVTCYATGAGGSVRGQLSLTQKEVAAVNTVMGVRFASTGANTQAVDLSAARAVTVTLNESVNSVADLVRIQTGNLIVMTPA